MVALAAPVFVASLGGGDALVEVAGGRFTIRMDRWHLAEAEDRCPEAERYQWAICFHDYPTRSEALAWYEGYQAGSRDNA